MTIVVALVILMALMLLRVPVFVALGAGSIIAFSSLHQPNSILAEKFFGGLDSFPLVAVPFFLFGAAILEATGVGHRIIALGDAVVGNLPAGLALSGFLSCALFASLSGSSVATLSSVGGIVIPEMIEHGYDPRFAVGSITVAGTLGMLIPPSIPLILFGIATNTNILTLFIAGLIPALILLVLLMTTTVTAYKLSWLGAPIPRRLPMRERIGKMGSGVGTLAYPLVIFVGIYGVPGLLHGYFTPSEAATFSVPMALLLGFVVYRDTPRRALRRVMDRSVQQVGMIMAIIGSATLLGFVFAASNVAQNVDTWVTGRHFDLAELIIVYNLLLILVGDYLEAVPIILIIVPIFYPLFIGLGMDPVQFGVITIVNIEIGCVTPPIGINLLVASSITGMPLHRVFRATVPWIAVLLVLLAAVSFIPELSLWLPHRLGYQ